MQTITGNRGEPERGTAGNPRGVYVANSGKLSAAEIDQAPPGKHADGGGPTLVVKPSGRRSWVARVTADGKRRDIGLGAYPAVGLDEARRRAAELRARALLIDRRGLPSLTHRTAAVPTFAQAAAAVHALNAPRWRSPRHSREWLDSLHRHAEPLLELPVDHITPAHVLEVLHPIWHDKPETARRVPSTVCRSRSRHSRCSTPPEISMTTRAWCSPHRSSPAIR